MASAMFKLYVVFQNKKNIFEENPNGLKSALITKHR